MNGQVKEFVKIPRGEYRDLLEKKVKYDELRSLIAEDIFSPPPARSADYVLAEFAATGKYSAAFLKSLERGLKRSSYFKK